MIKVEFPCTNALCENGLIKDIYAKIHLNEERPLVTCNVCNGTGKSVKHFGATTLIDVNMGDHGETRTEVIDFDSELTVKELLSKIFDPTQYRKVVCLTFSPGHLYYD